MASNCSIPMPAIRARDARSGFRQASPVSHLSMSAFQPQREDTGTCLHAAGSCASALTDLAKSFEAATGAKVQAKFGASKVC